MKNSKVLLAVVLVFALVLGGAYVLYDKLGSGLSPDRLSVQAQPETESDDTHAAHAEETSHAPDFTVVSDDGSYVQLSDYIGKPIVLNFWASWCGPCQSEMPDFNEMYHEIGSDVQFLMVNVTDGARETIQTATAFIDKNGYDFPVFFDTTGEASSAYGARSLPTTYFIDAHGHVVAQAIGAIDAATLKQGISMVGAG